MTYKEFYTKNEEIKNTLKTSKDTYTIWLIDKVKGYQIQVGEWVVTNQQVAYYIKTYPIPEALARVLQGKAFIRNLSKISHWQGFETLRDKKKVKADIPNTPVYLVTLYIKSKTEIKQYIGVFYNKPTIENEIERLSKVYKGCEMTYKIDQVEGEGGFVVATKL